MSPNKDEIKAKTLEEILENSDNVAELFDEDEQKAIARKVVDDYESDRQTVSGWFDKYDKAMELALQLVKTKSHPWPNSANVKFPLVMQAAISFNARAYPALMNGINPVKGQTVGVDSTGEKTAIAMAVEDHMNYQLLQQMEDWEEDMDRMLLILPIVGTAFKKTFRDLEENQNVSKLILPKHLILNYHTDPTRFKHTRKTEVFDEWKNEVVTNTRRGVYLDVDMGDPSGINRDELHRDNTDEFTGQEDTGDVDSDSAPFVQIEQHTWLDLDGDDYAEPYVVTVNLDHDKLLRIVPRFNPENGITRNDDGDIQFIEPIEFYTRFGFIPNPDGGVYDVGFGMLLGPINNTIDTAINQILDAGTMSNMPSGFIGKGARLNAQTVRIKPGEWRVIPTRGNSLKENIMPLPASQPSTVLFSMIELMIGAGQSLASSTSILQGEEQPTNQKATTSQITHTESMRTFTAIYKRLRKALSKEYQKLFLLNWVYETPESVQEVLDSPRIQQLGHIYNPELLRVVPAADPTIAVREERVQQLTSVLELGMRFGGIDLDVAKRRLLEAMEVAGIDELMPVNEDGQSALPEPGPSFEEIELRTNTQLQLREQNIKLLELDLNRDDTATKNQIKAGEVLQKILQSGEKIASNNESNRSRANQQTQES